MADERPEVATRGIGIPDVSGMSTQEVEQAVSEFAERFPGSAADMVLVVTKLNSSTSAMLAGLMARLGRRHQDIQELLSIVKTCQELNRKIERMGRRLLADEEASDVR